MGIFLSGAVLSTARNDDLCNLDAQRHPPKPQTYGMAQGRDRKIAWLVARSVAYCSNKALLGFVVARQARVRASSF